MVDQALGALLGVALGDAAGAPLERTGAAGPIDAAAVAAALELPGSASPLLGRGQTTDDTELTICLARGALGWDGCGQTPLQRAAVAHERLPACRRATPLPDLPAPLQACWATLPRQASPLSQWPASTATGTKPGPLAAAQPA